MILKRSPIDRIQGLYVPFYLYSGSADQYTAKAKDSDTPVQVTGASRISRYPISAFTKTDKNLMSRISPFDLSDLEAAAVLILGLLYTPALPFVLPFAIMLFLDSLYRSDFFKNPFRRLAGFAAALLTGTAALLILWKTSEHFWIYLGVSAVISLFFIVLSVPVTQDEDFNADGEPCEKYTITEFKTELISSEKK